MSDDLKIKIGNRIRNTRVAKGLTREQLSEYAGISVQFLALVEIGERGLSHVTIRNLSRALNVTTDFLLLFCESNEEIVNRRKYAEEAFVCLTENEHYRIQKQLDTSAGILRGYIPIPFKEDYVK